MLSRIPLRIAVPRLPQPRNARVMGLSVLRETDCGGMVGGFGQGKECEADRGVRTDVRRGVTNVVFLQQLVS